MHDCDCEYLCITNLLKATPSEEGGKRFVYFEASNESLDAQGEVVLAKALAESADYYRAYGNVDLDHFTQLGPKAGIKDYHLFEIGRPVDVQINSPRTFVKAELYQGESEVARNANLVWDSLTRISPPARWYPSVGGAVLEKGQDINGDGSKRTVIRRVRWSNVGLSKTPVNQTVPTVQTLPFEAMAKGWGPGGLDVRKAMEAGYGVDSAALTGGAALRRQSLDKHVQATLPITYWDFRERMSGDIRNKRVASMRASGLVEHAARQYGISRDEAATWVERFLSDLSTAKRVTQ